MATQLWRDRVNRVGEPSPAEDDGERASIVDTTYAGRARYFDSSNAFNLKYPPVPCHQFLRERDQLARVQAKLAGRKIAGLALILSHTRQARLRNVLPTLTLAMNQLPPRDFQRPHRHNSAAITLNIRCQGCYSMVGGRRIDWQPYAVMVTPPGEVHSHHNEGDLTMTCLIVQDGGLYHHCRTMGFEYAD
jgi:gentisate 1,2-dioxygenase